MANISINVSSASDADATPRASPDLFDTWLYSSSRPRSRCLAKAMIAGRQAAESVGRPDPTAKKGWPPRLALAGNRGPGGGHIAFASDPCPARRLFRRRLLLDVEKPSPMRFLFTPCWHAL